MGVNLVMQLQLALSVRAVIRDVLNQGDEALAWMRQDRSSAKTGLAPGPRRLHPSSLHASFHALDIEARHG